MKDRLEDIIDRLKALHEDTNKLEGVADRKALDDKLFNIVVGQLGIILDLEEIIKKV